MNTELAVANSVGHSILKMDRSKTGDNKRKNKVEHQLIVLKGGNFSPIEKAPPKANHNQRRSEFHNKPDDRLPPIGVSTLEGGTAKS
jgi:hypothetical protein